MISPDKQYEFDTNLYNPSEIEKKWQSIWTENNLYKTDKLTENSDKFYALSMFPTLQVIFIWDMLGIMLLQT